MDRNERAEEVAIAMGIVADSIRSHLPYTHGNIGASRRQNGESVAFHKKCVRDYARVLKTLSQFL